MSAILTHPSESSRDLAHPERAQQPRGTSSLGVQPAQVDVEALRAFYTREPDEILTDPLLPAFHERLLQDLEHGTIRTAQRDATGAWQAASWIKEAILIGFRAFPTVEQAGAFGPSFDRAGFPARVLREQDGVRLVPGGSAVRRGAFVASGVVIMPPAYVNVGAWVGAGTMIDSHALVGSCAQVGSGVHLSAGVQIGGVLEPAGARPVVIEDDAFIGAQSGVFEGVVVRARAVLAPGVQLTASTTLYDLVHEAELQGEVPEDAVVVPGARPAPGAFAAAHGLVRYAPMIVKYRDARTHAATALEGALR